MALEQFPNIGNPNWGFTDETDDTLNEVQFGDGYRLVQPAGLNHQRGGWSLTFSLEEADALPAYSWLKTRKKVTPFLWTHPDGTEYQVRCESVRLTYSQYNDYTLAVTLTQDFNPV